MSFTFRPGVREQVTLLIGLIGCSGAGKTYTAMRLAKGICGDKPFAVIDTEAGRAKHYADLFRFDHGDLKPPFRPEAYAEAIKSADEAGYKAIIVDSCSHEWSGEGGILDWQEEELTRMAGEDYHKREACKMAAWIKPKLGHKQMIQRLLQVRANLILCFRAEEKIEMKKDANGKMMIIPKGFQPVCSKEMPYELAVSFLLTPDKPGIPQPIKLQEQHKSLFPLDRQINEESGKRISEWALGKKDGEAIQEEEGEEGTLVHRPPSASPEFSIPIITSTIDGITKKDNKDKKGKPYTLYTIHVGGQKITTFSETFARTAKEFIEKKEPAVMEYEQTDYGMKLVSITPVE